MVAVVMVGSVLVLVWLVGMFLMSMASGGLWQSQSNARQQAVARQNAGTLRRAIRVKQALDAEAFAAHRRMVAHATSLQQQRQSGR